MKFGKDLQQYRAPGWEDDYIDYKGLKLILKQLENPEVTKEDVDGEFFQELEENLEKVRAWRGNSGDAIVARRGGRGVRGSRVAMSPQKLRPRPFR